MKIKTALVDTSSRKELHRSIAKVLGRDVLVWKESFFKTPPWWAFRNVEWAPLCAKSVEILKDAGLLAYFWQLSDAKSQEAVREQSGEECTGAARRRFGD